MNLINDSWAECLLTLCSWRLRKPQTAQRLLSQSFPDYSRREISGPKKIITAQEGGFALRRENPDCLAAIERGIRLAMLRRGISIPKLSSMMNLTRQYLHRMLSDSGNLKLETVVGMMQVLNCTFVFVLYYAEGGRGEIPGNVLDNALNHPKISVLLHVADIFGYEVRIEFTDDDTGDVIYSYKGPARIKGGEVVE